MRGTLDITRTHFGEPELQPERARTAAVDSAAPGDGAALAAASAQPEDRAQNTVDMTVFDSDLGLNRENSLKRNGDFEELRRKKVKKIKK